MECMSINNSSPCCILIKASEVLYCHKQINKTALNRILLNE
jgi:hypothetical protein